MAVSYKTKDAQRYQREFKNYVISEAKNQNWNTQTNKSRHFYVDAVFYFARTDQDANNYFKVMLDAITDTQLIWEDDNVVCERVQAIYYDSNNPRVELTIYPTDYIGVFENSSQLEKFESNCVGCKRYKRNCSLLKNAKEGRIQKEIDGECCLRYSPISEEFCVVNFDDII